jgi:hypothetical protein
MSELKYSAGMVSKPFWFIEFKKVIKLLNEGYTFKEIQQKSITENIFGAAKEYRNKEIFNGVSRRAKMFDDELIKLFCKTDLITSKVMALYSYMKIDKLFFEFMYEVYREKVKFGLNELKESDIMIFFKDKQGQDAAVASWKDCTLKKLCNSYINNLLEAGMLSIDNDIKKITIPILDNEFEEYLMKNKEEHYLYALTGVK